MSVLSLSIPSSRKRAMRSPDWNIDSLRVTVFDVSAAKNRDHRRVRCPLRHLGIDLSRDFFRHPINPALPNGGRAFLSGGPHYVGNRSSARSAQVDLA